MVITLSSVSMSWAFQVLTPYLVIVVIGVDTVFYTLAMVSTLWAVT